MLVLLLLLRVLTAPPRVKTKQVNQLDQLRVQGMGHGIATLVLCTIHYVSAIVPTTSKLQHGLQAIAARKRFPAGIDKVVVLCNFD